MSFKTGDVVKLKSGGPAMTVTGQGSDGNGNPRTNCTWFGGDDTERNGAFPAEALQSASARTENPSGLATS
jgi:uncharacterized protein YodC (DUF2158 family)